MHKNGFQHSVEKVFKNYSNGSSGEVRGDAVPQNPCTKIGKMYIRVKYRKNNGLIRTIEK